MFFREGSIEGNIDSFINELNKAEYNFNTINYLASNIDYNVDNNNNSDSNQSELKNDEKPLNQPLKNQSRGLEEKRAHIKFLLSKKREKSPDTPLIESQTKEEKKRQRNREAADKSRKKKKQELLYLIQENNCLKQEIDEYNKTINQLCTHCKCKFNQSIDMHCLNNSESNDIVPTISSSPSSFMSLSMTRPYSFFLSCLLTICIFLCLMSNRTDSSLSQRVQESASPETRNLNEEYEKSHYTPIKAMPQILIDDPQSKMSYYVNFEDFYKLRNKNMDICRNPLIDNIVNNKSVIIEKKKKTYYDSIYFKLFVPLCNEGNVSHLNYFLNDIVEENPTPKENDTKASLGKDNQTQFYYEVECQIMNFTKMIRKMK